MERPDNIIAPLENYVELIRKLNKDLITEVLVGVDVNKNLIEDKVKGKKTELRKLQIVEKGHFVMSGMSPGRDRKVPVALYRGDSPVLTSSSNKFYVFRVKGSQLFNEYLNLIFKTERIDRVGVYLSGQGCRGELTWKNFSQVLVSVPPRYKQERIVYRYQTVSKYIDLKRRINDLFERQMTVFFHILFDNLSEYTVKKFKELLTITLGKRPPRSNKYLEELYFCEKSGIPWLQVQDITEQRGKFVHYTSEQLTFEGFERCKGKIFPKGSIILISGGVGNKALGKIRINLLDLTANCSFWAIQGILIEEYQMITPTTYIYFLIRENVGKLKQMINSSTDRVSFNLQKFRNFEIKLPPQPLIDKFNNFCEPIFELQKHNEQIIQKLLRIQKGWIETLD